MWRDSGFPQFTMPTTIKPSVHTQVWKEKISNLPDRSRAHVAVPLLSAVLEQLQQGACSGVKHPGSSITKYKNFLPDPEDCMKLADALATEVKAGNMTGPMVPSSVPNVKINSFMAVPKPGGHRRQVGNMSAPKGRSFNDGISEATLSSWQVIQTTARQFSHKIVSPDATQSCQNQIWLMHTKPLKYALNRDAYKDLSYVESFSLTSA